MKGNQEPQMTLHNYTWIIKRLTGFAEPGKRTVSAPRPTHRLQQQHNPPLPAEPPQRDAATAASWRTAKTSPTLQAAQGKPACTQHARVRTTHKGKIFPSWELMALSWLTVRSSSPGGINPPSTRGTAQVRGSLLPNRHSWGKNEAHHLPTGTTLPNIYPL